MMIEAVSTAVTDWLLKSDIPQIRYQTLTDLLDFPEDNKEVRDAKRAIMAEGPVRAILARQLANGTWVRDAGYYTPKYQSTHWTMMLLVELGIDSQNEQFQLGVDYMLDTTANDLQRRLDENHLGFSCLWGNILRYALHAGRQNDPRVEPLIDYAVRDLNRGPCQCQYNDNYACAWGVVRFLWGLVAIPAAERTAAVSDAIDKGIGFMLDAYQLVDANYPTPDGGKIHTLWSKLSFPLFYQADILFTLRILAELDALDDPRTQPALDWLHARRQKSGR